MSGSLIDLTARKGLSWLATVVQDLRTAAGREQVLLVGAQARDLLLHHMHGVPITRATTDVDLAFAVADWDDFDTLRQALLHSGDFDATKSVVHRLIHRTRVPVDLIPFGGVESPDNSIVWPDDETEMSVLGYREAVETAVDAVLPGGVHVSTVSIPMLAVLKLIAWSHRHVHAPAKDASDLLLILSNYFKVEDEIRLYNEASHLLEAEDFDYDAAGAWLAGHDAGLLVARCENPKKVIDYVESILTTETDPNGPLRLIGEVGAGEPDRKRQLLEAFLAGFKPRDSATLYAD